MTNDSSRSFAATGAAPSQASSVREPLAISVQSGSIPTHAADIAVVGAYADHTLPPAATAIDVATGGKLSVVLKRNDLDAKVGSSLLLYDLPQVTSPRVLLVSLGEREAFGEKAFREALAGAARGLMASKATTAAVALPDIPVQGRSAQWRIETAARILADGAYRFPAPRAKPAQNNGTGVRAITLLIAGQATPELVEAARRGQAMAEGMALTKDLGNLPGNVCNPLFMAETAKQLGKELGMDVEILEREDMAKLGMGSALSVGRASAQPCKFIVLSYRGGPKDAKPIVLVGKGVTFDTGGVSLKPGDDLDMMKYDMSGAAAVFGAMRTAGLLKLPLNVTAIVGAVENMPGGDASRPGDVVTSMSGQTIEILNTDAEGRLVLCDALTYAERYKPACVIDVATLTGACVIALGSQTSGLFANNDTLANELLESGTSTGDRAWRMPLWDEYQDQLKSNFADMSNLGGRPAGSITAACFLARFAGAYPWAHLDIAGTASVGGDAKGATGRPVPLLSDFLVRRANGATQAARAN